MTGRTRPSGRRVFVVAVAVSVSLTASGCATPSSLREGSLSDRVRQAYFAADLPGDRLSTAGCAGRDCPGMQLQMQLPEPRREFDPARDARVVFVAVFGPPRHQGDLRVVGTLHAPTRETFAFGSTIPADRVSDGSTVFHAYPIASLKHAPGAWLLMLMVDGELAGVYTFLLGDEATRTRLRGAEDAALKGALEFIPGIPEAATSRDR